jgi:hypothetical protein
VNHKRSDGHEDFHWHKYYITDCHSVYVVPYPEIPDYPGAGAGGTKEGETGAAAAYDSSLSTPLCVQYAGSDAVYDKEEPGKGLQYGV